MSAAHAIHDTTTLLRRNLLRARRYPSVTVAMVLVPAVVFLLFVYVFGASLGAGLGPLAGGGTGRAGYADYLAPGIMLFSVIGSAQGTAIAVATDMTEGFLARLRTMPIWRASVLAGHVLAAVAQSLLGVGLLVALAVAVGFRPTAGAVGWLAAVGLLTLVALAMTWLSVAFGLAARTVAGASNMPLPLILLPFLGNGFVPVASMPTGLRWFATYQPFSPVNETLRGLLLGGHIGASAPAAVAWLAAVTVAGYLWALRLYDRPRTAAA